MRSVLEKVRISAFILILGCALAGTLQAGMTDITMTPLNLGNEAGAAFFWIHEGTGCGGMCGAKLWQYDAGSSSQFVWTLNDPGNDGLSAGDQLTGGQNVIGLVGLGGNPDALFIISNVMFTLGPMEAGTAGFGDNGRWFVSGGFDWEVRRSDNNALIESGGATFAAADLAGFTNTAWMDNGKLNIRLWGPLSLDYQNTTWGMDFAAQAPEPGSLFLLGSALLLLAFFRKRSVVARAGASAKSPASQAARRASVD